MLKATTIGNLGNDPELRYSASGSPFLRFTLRPTSVRGTRAASGMTAPSGCG